MLFRTSSLANGILFNDFLFDFSLEGYAFWLFWSKKCQISVIPVKKPKVFNILVQRMRKFAKFCLENVNSWHF